MGKSYCEILTSCLGICAKPNDSRERAPSSASTLGKRPMKFSADSKSPRRAGPGRYANFIFFCVAIPSALSLGCAENTKF
jgi:hypothetical protein